MRMTLIERVASHLPDSTILSAVEADRIRLKLYEYLIMPAPEDQPDYEPMPLMDFLYYKSNVHRSFYCRGGNANLIWLGYDSGIYFTFWNIFYIRSLMMC